MLKEGMFIQDRYEIISKIGSGGMADVYKAKDHTLNRFVAVKVLKPEFRKDKGFITKFRVEAQSAGGQRYQFHCHGAGRRDHLKRIYREKGKTRSAGSDQHCDPGIDGAAGGTQQRHRPS